jgi:hypothetical protein
MMVSLRFNNWDSSKQPDRQPPTSDDVQHEGRVEPAPFAMRCAQAWPAGAWPAGAWARSLSGIRRSFGTTALQHIRQGLTTLGKRQGNRIEAVPLTRGTRTVGKHVAEMAAASRADLFHANHSVAGVANAFDVGFIIRHEEARPAGA